MYILLRGGLDMQIVEVRSILNVDTISRTTGAWKELMRLADEVNDDITFDFRGIQLLEPWTNEDFKQLMKNERVYLKVYTAVDIRDTIELMLAIGNLKTGRVENEDIMTEATLSDNEKKVIEAREQILENFKDIDDTVFIAIGNIRSYITNSIIIDGMREAIEERIAEGKKIFKIDLSGLTITDPMLLKLAELINKFDSQGIIVEMISNDEEAIGKILTFQCVGSKKLSPRERFDIFRDTIKPKTVGMLTRYHKTGRLDSLGRMGDGEPIMCRPAIFEGFVKKNNIVVAKFTTFPGDTFITRQDFYLDNDGARLKRPKVEYMYITMSDIGICDKFTGKEFHFNMPIQLNIEDSYTTYRVNGDNVQTIKVLLPEYIKRVLDDYDIEYDNGALLDAIIENKKLFQ